MSTIRDVWLHAHSIIRSARQIINQELQPLGLGSTEGNILLHLMVINGPVCQEDLAQQLEVTKAAISRAVESLESKGYLIRLKDRNDKRFYQLMLTDKARQSAPTIEHAYDHVYSLATREISDDDYCFMVELLSRIANNLSQTKKEDDVDGDAS